MRLNWFARHSRRPSLLRRWLRLLGQSWSASPLRRIVQTAFFAVFLALFFYAAWPHGTGPAGQIRAAREWIDIETFLALDPLVSISAAIAARELVWSLAFAAVLLAISLVLPRFFCGYACPMGTLIDLFDWAVSNRVHRFRLARPSWWRHLRYYILAAVLVAAACGVTLSGYVAAIPTVTRGFQFVASPLQIGLVLGWDRLSPLGAAQAASILLLAVVLLLGLLRPRFWCRYVCPSGAVFSILNLLRLTERKVQSHCIQCGKCAKACSFDAINDDFQTIGANCAFCQTCAGICPVGAIDFGFRTPGWSSPPASRPLALRVLSPAADMSRRGFVAAAAFAALGGGLAAAGLRTTRTGPLSPVLRPPGSVAEDLFTRLCVRCGQCLRVCPTGILQPSGLANGLDGLWTPFANADLAACDPACNNCGHVCPTGAIAALSMETKKQTRMGLAEVDQEICLACRQRADCQTLNGTSLICFDACEAAGYSAIILQGEPDPIPSVNPDPCVGCGACQAACFHANVIRRKLLGRSAIPVHPIGSPREQASRRAAGQPAPTDAPAASTKISVPYSIPDD